MGLALGWLILTVMVVIFLGLVLAAIHWVMEGYQYDKWKKWDERDR